MRGWCVMVSMAAVLIAGCGPEPAARPRPVATAAERPEPVPVTPASPAEREAPRDGWTPDVPLHDWEFIVLHHTATDGGDVETIDRQHRQRKDSSGNAWRGIAYHFLIGNGRGMKDGEIEPTFRWQEQSEGAHAGSLKHNATGIGVCLVGNFNDAPPTKKQRAALKELMSWLQQETGIPDSRVLKHSDIKATACPGRKFSR